MPNRNHYEEEKALLEGKTMADLKSIAKALGLSQINGLRKADLISVIIGAKTMDSYSQNAPSETEQMDNVSICDYDSQCDQQDAYQPQQPSQQYAQKMPSQQFNQPIQYGQQSQCIQQPLYSTQQQYTQQQYNQPPKQQQFNQRSQQNNKRSYTQRQESNYRQNNSSYPQQQRKPAYNNQQSTNYTQGNYPQQNNNYQQQAAYQQRQPYNSEIINPTYQPQFNQQPQQQFIQDTQYCYKYSEPAISEYQQESQIDELVTDGILCSGVIEVLSEGYGFLRSKNHIPGSSDVYVSNPQIKKIKLRTGDLVEGYKRPLQAGEKYPPMLKITKVNGREITDDIGEKDLRPSFDTLIPIYPDKKITLDYKGANSLALRLIDLVAPIGKGQRGLIVSQPKSGKTTLLKSIANSITKNYPDIYLIVLLIDERPEEVTDIYSSIIPDTLSESLRKNREVLYSTFDELPEHHTRVAEMAMERSMRLVEEGKDVMVLMDSITRLARAYNITLPASGKTLSGGMDPTALYKPKRFFGAARNIKGGGSLTIISTALVETGSKMDDIVYEEFKGTGNMEIHLDRKLAERRIFPAVDIYKSGTRHDELLLSTEEYNCMKTLRRVFAAGNTLDVTEHILKRLSSTSSKNEFIANLNSFFSNDD